MAIPSNIAWMPIATWRIYGVRSIFVDDSFVNAIFSMKRNTKKLIRISAWAKGLVTSDSLSSKYNLNF
jgi:hypothetical protein